MTWRQTGGCPRPTVEQPGSQKAPFNASSTRHIILVTGKEYKECKWNAQQIAHADRVFSAEGMGDPVASHVPHGGLEAGRVPAQRHQLLAKGRLAPLQATTGRRPMKEPPPD